MHCSKAVQEKKTAPRDYHLATGKNPLFTYFGLIIYLSNGIFRGHPYAFKVKWLPMQILRWRKVLYLYLSSVLVFSHLILSLHHFCNYFENGGAGLVQGLENVWLHFSYWCWYLVISRVLFFSVTLVEFKGCYYKILIAESSGWNSSLAIFISACFQKPAVDWQSLFFLTEWFHLISSTIYYMALKL